MLKTISAALFAASVIAAPALAAETGKTTGQSDIKSDTHAKAKEMNSNASMSHKSARSHGRHKMAEPTTTGKSGSGHEKPSSGHEKPSSGY